MTTIEQTRQTTPAPSTARAYRNGVVARTVAAIGGSYLLSALVTRALASTLPLRGVDAVVAATLAGLATYPLAVMWAFAAASAPRAATGIAAACFVPGVVVLAMHITGSAA